jgi:hypothetical protein
MRRSALDDFDRIDLDSRFPAALFDQGVEAIPDREYLGYFSATLSGASPSCHVRIR